MTWYFYVYAFKSSHKFWNDWLINLKGTISENKSLNKNFETRNYRLETYEINPKISYLLSTKTRFDIFYNYLNKENQLNNFEHVLGSFECL